MRTRIILMTLLAGRFASAEEPAYLAEHLSQCISWELAIYKSGFAHERLSDTCFESPKSYSRLHHISASQLLSLQKALSQARFQELPKSIDPTSYQSEEDWFVITVYTSEGEKTVTAEALERAANREQAQRFEQVWATVNGIVHEPSYK